MDNCGKTPRCPLMCPSNPYLMSWFIFALSNRSLIYETASPSHTVFVLAVQWALIASFSSLSAHWQGRHTFCCNEQSSSSSAPLFTPLWSLTQKTLISEVEKKTVSFKCKFEKKGAGGNFLSFRKSQTKRRGGLSHCGHHVNFCSRPVVDAPFSDGLQNEESPLICIVEN